MLAGTPYPVHAVAAGVEGLRWARERRPQAIFLDLLMPGMNGFEVLEQLKADPATHSIPVIVVTSKKLNPAEEQQLARQAQAVLSKAALSQKVTLETLTGDSARRNDG
jgi:CheY-like chemotaxis protein